MSNAVAKPLGSFTNVPLEVLNMIVGEIKYVEDAFSLVNSCTTFQHQLGKRNRLLWFKVGKSRNAAVTIAKYNVFDAKYNYFNSIERMAGLQEKKMKRYCMLCFLGATNNIDVAGYRICLECARENSLPTMEVRLIPGLPIAPGDMFSWPSQYHADVLSLPYADENDYLAMYMFKPTVERKVAILFPNNTFEQVLAWTLPHRTAYDNRCAEYYTAWGGQDCNRIVRSAEMYLGPTVNTYLMLKGNINDYDSAVSRIVAEMGPDIRNLAAEKNEGLAFANRRAGMGIHSPNDAMVARFGRDIAMQLTFKSSRFQKGRDI